MIWDYVLLNLIPLNFLVSPPTVNPIGECPDNFQDLDPASEFCYMVSSEGDLKSWGDAHGECFAHDALLASIHSEDAMTNIQAVLQGKSSDVWIGLQADGKLPWFYIWNIP